jgi:small subunit ribosomal protein S20
MANIKANIKTIRKDKKRKNRNKIVLSALKTNVKNSRTSPSKENLTVIYTKVDSACSKGKIHKNKANRIKSRLAKLANKSK